MAEFAEVMNQMRRMCDNAESCGRCILWGGFGTCRMNQIPCNHSEDKIARIESDVAAWAKKNPSPRYPSYYEHTTKILPTLNPNFFFGRCLCDLYGEEARPPRCDGAGNHEISCKACWARVMSAKIAKVVGAEKKQYLEDT